MTERSEAYLCYKDQLDPKPNTYLTSIEEVILKHCPSAMLELKWGKPAATLNGIICVFAAYKKHISVHPTPSVIESLSAELADIPHSQNAVQFSYLEPLPMALIEKIIQRRVYEKHELGVLWK